MSLFKAPKKIDILRLFPPPEEVHQSTLCRWPRTSTCWHPKPRCFLEPQTTLFDRRPRGGGFPGGNKNIGNFQYRWRKSENRWLSFFLFVFGVFVLTVGSSIGECSHFFLVLFVEISDGVRHGEQNYLWESLNTSFDSKKSNNRQ